MFDFLKGKADPEKLYSKRDVQGLINVMLNDKDSRNRVSAAYYLNEIKDPSIIESWFKALNDEEYDVREWAIDALSEIGNSRAIDQLVILLNDPDKWIRDSAAEELGKSSDIRVIKPIIQRFRDDFFRTRKSAAQSWDKLNKLHQHSLNDSDKLYYFIAKKDWNNVVTIGEPAIEPLIKLLSPEFIRYNFFIDARGQFHHHAEFILEIANVLNRISDRRMIQPIMYWLYLDDDQHTLINILYKFGEPTIKPLLSILISDLDDKNDRLDYYQKRYLIGNATLFFSKVGEPALPSLNEFSNNNNPKIREIIVITCGKIKSLLSIELAVKMLKDKNSDVRIEAAKSLAQLAGYGLDSEKAVLPLITALKDAHWEVEYQSAIALGIIGDERAVKPLIEARDSNKNSYLTEAAQYALSQGIKTFHNK